MNCKSSAFIAYLQRFSLFFGFYIVKMEKGIGKNNKKGKNWEVLPFSIIE